MTSAIATGAIQRLATATLAAELRMKVKESGLVLWLDAERRYTGLVDALQRRQVEFPYPVVAFRGSYLELMLALEPYGNGLEKDHVLVHLPGLNTKTVRDTPVFELYEAGTTFEKALPTLVREASVGTARPDEVEELLRSPSLTLEAADAWLGDLRAAPRDRITLLLENVGVEDVVVGLVTEDPRFRDHLPASTARVIAYLERSVGLSPAWSAFLGIEGDLSPHAMASLVASWLMAVEYVHDLKGPPRTPALAALQEVPALTVKECRRLIVRLREREPDLYETYATELQDRLTEERTGADPASLGAIDTLRFEEQTLRKAAIRALQEKRPGDAVRFAAARTVDRCFWVKRSTTLQRVWELVRLAAELGEALDRTRGALDGCRLVDEAVDRYAEKLADVDRLHRVFEQRAKAVLAPDLEDHDALLEVRRTVRAAHRSWADATSRAFFELCLRHGPLPSAHLRQRTVFEDEVKPLVDRGARVAYVLVDALRFEMAQGLATELERENVRCSLKPRLAELPTETVIGMNALAPVERNGRLRLAQDRGAPAGFRLGEFTVAQPKHRVRAIAERVGVGTVEDIELEEFADLDLQALKRRLFKKASIVVVRSRELDTAGEGNLHLGTFEQTLGLLRNAISLLSQAGIEKMVVTADHGFLLQDPTMEAVPFGATKRVAQRRHALLAERSGAPDVLELPFSALDYDVEQEGYLVFRADTAPWKVSEKIAAFVHGGNSLQERVIPVLLLERRLPRGKTLTRYEVVARPEPARLGRQRLRVAVRLQDRENATLGFAGPGHIALSLRVKSEGEPRDDLQLVILDASPPASLEDGQIQIPPNREEAVVEFELEGMFDEKVRIEVFHPGAREEVAPKIVEGFFDVARRRVPRAPTAPPPPPPEVAATPEVAEVPEASPPPSRRPAAPPGDPSWKDLIEDEGYRSVFSLLAAHGVVNEEDLARILGSSRRVRIFARAFDELVQRVPFEVEILTIGALKAYKRRG